MKFEYDNAKSNANKEKHGISFEEAKALWQDANLLEVPLSLSDEKRYLCIGKVADKHYSAIITYRNSVIRIISVRRSRKEEALHYENR